VRDANLTPLLAELDLELQDGAKGYDVELTAMIGPALGSGV